MRHQAFIRCIFFRKASSFVAALCFLLSSALPAFSQTGAVVKGVVTDSSGQPVPGVTVWAPALNIAALSEADGSYSISLPPGGAEIHFDCMGYESQTVKITESRRLDISLADEVMMLENAVVVGYGTQRKETVTGSVTAVTTKDLLQSPQQCSRRSHAGTSCRSEKRRARKGRVHSAYPWCRDICRRSRPSHNGGWNRILKLQQHRSK